MNYLKIATIILTLASPQVIGQTLTKAQTDFLTKNAKTVCKTDLSQADWNVLSTNLKDKNIILLGEFNHGSKEIFQLRISLIKHLHEKLGINVILFESGIGELALADNDKSKMTAAQMIDGLFGPWRTKEFVELMDYVRSQNISIAGFDVQRTGGPFQYFLKDVATKNGIDSTSYYNLESRYGLIARELNDRKAIYDSVKSKTETLIHDYQDMQNALQKSTTQEKSKDLLLSVATIKNRIRFLSYMLAFVKDKNLNVRWAARDSAMADNINWLMENIYENEKVIVVGHNFHISKFNENELTAGEVLSRTHSKEMYSLGFFAGKGSYHDNSGKEVQLQSPDSSSLDIRHIIQALKGSVNYINMPLGKQKGREWLDNEITVNDTFIDLKNSTKMILSKCFDGLILLEKVSPPE